MSVYVHRCISCGHNDLEHEQSGSVSCSFGWCPCQRSRGTVAKESPSELIPRWKVFTGQSLDDVLEPGSLMRGAPPAIQVCGCKSCVAAAGGAR